MARKAVQGYPEKSYYENTKFSGIVATSDPLNEGSFALITNFDITDTGMSVTPRKGFLSTTFQCNNIPIITSNKSLMFHDTNLNKKIIIDLNKVDDVLTFGYIVDINQYNINNNILKDAHNIYNYDINDFVSYFKSNDLVYTDATIESESELFEHIIRNTILHQTFMLPIKDLDAVTYYMSHAEYYFKKDDKEYHEAFWFKILYREKETKRGDTTFSADTLVISVVETEQQNPDLDSRNIASSKSIIPDPLKTLEAKDFEGESDTEVTYVSDTLLFATNTFEHGWQYNELLLDTIYRNHVERLKIIPTYYLQDPTRILNTADASWAYRFLITDMSTNDKKELGISYKTPWYDLYSNTLLDKTGGYTLTGKTESHTLTGTKTFLVFPTDESYAIYNINSDDISTLIYKEGDVDYNTNIHVDVNDPRHRTQDIAYSVMTERQIASNAYSAAGISKFLKHDYAARLMNSKTYEELAENNLFIYAQNAPNYVLVDLDDIITLRENAYSEFTATFNDDFITTLDNPDSYLYPEYGTYKLNSRKFVSRDLILTKTEYDSLTKYNNRVDIKNILKDAYENNIDVNIHTMSNVLHINNRVKNNGEWVTDNEVYVMMNTQAIYGHFITWQYVYHKDLTWTPDYRHPINKPDFKMPAFDSIVDHKSTITFKNIYNQVYLYNFYNNLNTTESYGFNDFVIHGMLDIFKFGINVTLLLVPYNTEEYNNATPSTDIEKESIGLEWEAQAFRQSTLMTWAHKKDVVYLEEYSQYIDDFKNIKDFIIFENRIVVWNNNKVFLSDEGNYNNFSGAFVFELNEKVLKVLEFKTILLVFTTQNLYALYRKEVETPTGEVTEEGQQVNEKKIIWHTQPVLYNINPDPKYLDVIQVYNQMILFYSTEGQLYLIKPSPTIDSETQFGIQYFNKSANDILLNYDKYINERLIMYHKLDVNTFENYVTKDDVEIKALLDIDTIKIFYSVPNVITFILIYDVVNNRYTTYDTLTFTRIESTHHVEGGDMYVTEVQGNFYYTMQREIPYTPDSNVDQHYMYMFKKEPLFALLDTGNLNLNNHLRKRFRDLRIHLKNINATKIIYNASMIVDDNLLRPFYAPEFRVRMMNGPDYNINLEKVSKEDITELLGPDLTIGQTGLLENLHSYYLHEDRNFYEENALLRTETLNSSGLIEYNSSIIGVGKTARLKLLFISKGKYKLQSFGIVYKERNL